MTPATAKAAAAIALARARGVELKLIVTDGAPTIRCGSQRPIPDELLAVLREAKLDIQLHFAREEAAREAVRRTPPAGPNGIGPLREYYFSYAGLLERERGATPEVAARRAYSSAVETWCRANPPESDPDVCAGCGSALKGSELRVSGLARKRGEQVLAKIKVDLVTMTLHDKSVVHAEAMRNWECVIMAGRLRRERMAKELAALGLPPPEGWEP